MKSYKIIDTSVILCMIYQAKFPEIFEIIIKEGYNILIPKEVYIEVKEDIKIIAELFKNKKIDLLPAIDEEEAREIRNRHPSLGDGEIGVLVCGKNKISSGEKCRCIIDDRDAKLFAKKEGLNVNGVMGVLLWLKKLDKINKEDCLKIYEGLNNNPRIPKDLLEKLTK